MQRNLIGYASLETEKYNSNYIQEQQRKMKFASLGVVLAITTVVAAAIVVINKHVSFVIQNLFVHRPTLTMREGDDGQLSFRVLQLTDLHLGEAPQLDWGPANDLLTLNCISTLVALAEPDLIVLTGDQLTANNIDANASIYQNLIGDTLDQFGIPWTTIYGNHDDAGLVVDSEDGTSVIYTGVTKTPKSTLVRVDQGHTLSLTRAGPQKVDGVSNYALNVTQEDDTVLQLLFLDTGGGTTNQSITESQLLWLEEARMGQRDVPAALFQHIPTSQFGYDDDICAGENGDGGFAPLSSDAGLINALAADPNVLFVAVGHNHGNDYCCPTDAGITLCFGRHSGYGGYGRYAKGGRVYDFRMSEGTLQWSSYVQMEFGTTQDEYDPSSN